MALRNPNQASQLRTVRSKYRNTKVIVDGLKFDSKKEAARWAELKMLQDAGEISELFRQTRFDFVVGPKNVKVCAYIADFTYRTRDGSQVVEDVKSPYTRKLPVYRMKKKLMQACYGIEIREV